MNDCFLFILLKFEPFFKISFSLFHINATTDQSQYSKNYTNDEEHDFRMMTFLQNRNQIAEHNKLFNEGHVSFKMGLNEYSDMTSDEFSTIMNGYSPTDDFK